ncbi:hypothetical protein QYF61_020921 [Mycteria americana]|uniref:Nucleoside diphosphate kinase n=1 Tax=Mycteria americana TaxID=33587 RepID=A0AAN7MXA5_MYCAM|nr:hypothetical protein QYF61_020921 [Mycteria americana]
MICLVLGLFAGLFQSACSRANERTFVAIKPDGVQRHLVGEIIRRFERKGLQLVGLKLLQVRGPARPAPLLPGLGGPLVPRGPGWSKARAAPQAPALSPPASRLVQPAAATRAADPHRPHQSKAISLLEASEELLKEHYIALRDRPFYSRLVKYMSSGPVVAMVWQGLDVVKTVRTMIGETNPAESRPGTIRGDFCVEVSKNVIHGSDSVESARQEISLWFRSEELTCWEDTAEHWIYA